MIFNKRSKRLITLGITSAPPPVPAADGALSPPAGTPECPVPAVPCDTSAAGAGVPDSVWHRDVTSGDPCPAPPVSEPTGSEREVVPVGGAASRQTVQPVEPSKPATAKGGANSCGFCSRSVPANADFCSHCGHPSDRYGHGGDTVSRGTEENDEIYLGDQLQDHPESEAGSDTRKLASHPTPGVLSETAILVPAFMTLVDPVPPPGQERVFQLKIGQTAVGRGADNDISFPDEEFISRRHCEINYHKYQYVFVDLKSANGSYVNDVKIQETILRDGDSIQMGAMRFVFEDPVEQAKKKRGGWEKAAPS